MLNFCKSEVMIPAPLEYMLQMQGGEDLKSDHHHYHQTPLCQFIKTMLRCVIPVAYVERKVTIMHRMYQS